MNYAQDALWWRLHNPHVRALASILTAPTLWYNRAELTVRQLLGEQGFRKLLALDENPHALLHELAQKPQIRMGLYAEQLLAFWFQYAPHSRLLAHNLHLTWADKQGSADFVVELNGSIYHIELTCKYYYSHNNTEANLHGINKKDTFSHKKDKINQQLKLGQSPAFYRWLDEQHITQAVQAASIIRGMVFWQVEPAVLEHINPHAWQGGIIGIEQLQNMHTFIYPLSPLEYLAPAYAHAKQCQKSSTFICHQPTLVALMGEREKNIYHEQKRILVLC